MSELRECPRCKGSVSLQRFNVHPSLKARIICSCGIEMRASKRDSVEDLIERWNTRAERTCVLEDIPYEPGRWEGVRCSSCGVTDEDTDLSGNYCPDCGAKVVEP